MRMEEKVRGQRRGEEGRGRGRGKGGGGRGGEVRLAWGSELLRPMETVDQKAELAQ